MKHQKEQPIDDPPYRMPSDLWDLWLAADKAVRMMSPELQVVALQVRADIRAYTKIHFYERMLGELMATLMMPANRERMMCDPMALKNLFDHVDAMHVRLKKFEDNTV